MRVYIMTLTNPLCDNPWCVTHNPATTYLLSQGILACEECEAEVVDEDGNPVPEEPRTVN